MELLSEVLASLDRLDRPRWDTGEAQEAGKPELFGGRQLCPSCRDVQADVGEVLPGEPCLDREAPRLPVRGVGSERHRWIHAEREPVTVGILGEGVDEQ